MIDMDAGTQSFYNDFFKTPDSDNLLFGLTTARMGRDGNWEMGKRRAGSVEVIEDWLHAGIRHKYECHLSLGYIPATIVDLQNPQAESFGTYEKKDLGITGSRCFVLDLDVHHNAAKKRKDTDYRDAEHVDSTIQKALDAGMPEPNYIVRTGSGGAHLWYFIKNPIDELSHKLAMKHLCEVAKSYGVMSDPQAGYARKTLRAPGSWNMKPHIKACARTEKTKMAVYSNRQFKNSWGIEYSLKLVQASEILEAKREESNLQDYEEYTSADVKDSCRYMLYQLSTGSKELYREQWLGVATVVRHLQNWPEAWATACKKHYGDVDDSAIESALDAESGLRGPISCEAMGGGIGNHPACDGCRHREMPRGSGYPINWIQHVAGLRAAEIAVPKRHKELLPDTEETSDDYSDEVRYQAPRLQSVTDIEGVMGYGARQTSPGNFSLALMETKRGKRVYEDDLCSQAFYVDEVIRRTTGAVAVIETMDAAYEIPNESLQQDRALARALGSIGFQVHSPKHVYYYVQNQLQQFPPKDTFEAKSAGWNPKFSEFTTLEELIRSSNLTAKKQNSVMENPPLGGSMVNSVGTVEGWANAIRPMIDHKAHVLQFFLLMGFAAPLVSMRSQKAQASALVSAYHPDTGKGKSTGLRVMNSVFMKPLETNIGFNDTDASMFQDIGSMKNIGVTIDEVTSKIASYEWDGVAFVNTLLQGQERGRLQSNAKRADRASWDTIVGISTNASITDKLRDSRAVAAMARVHEFFFDKLPMPKYSADSMLEQLGKNHGVVGPEFIRCLMGKGDYRKEVAKSLDKKIEYLESRVGGTNAHRFVMTTFGSALLARDLLQEFEILNIPRVPFVDWCVEELQKRAQSDTQQSRRAETPVSDFYNSKYLEIYSAKGDLLNETTEAMMRTPERPIFYANGYLFVDDLAFTEWCRKARVPNSVRQVWKVRGYHDGETERRSFKVGMNLIAETDYMKIDVSAALGGSVRQELDQKVLERAGQ